MRTTIRKLVTNYIGGGWGKDAPDARHAVPASVIRGTDLDSVLGGETDGVPLRYHVASNVRSRALLPGDIVFEVSGGSKDQPVGRSLLLTAEKLSLFGGQVIPASFCKRITPDQSSVNSRFLHAHLQLVWADRRIVQWQVQSTGISNFNFEAFLDDFEIDLPPLPVQNRIADILSVYDDLIENSQRRIRILEAMARALYREWFVDFRFPGYESVPRVASPLGEIPQGWEVKTLREIAENFDRLRKPLSKIQRAEMQGEYPYYGAAKVFDYVNDFIFDGEYLLMAEDGSVITDERTPVLQLVNGKFWPNNHTHVLRGKGLASTHFLYLGLSQVDVSPYITGAAQPKITQENMNRIPFFCGSPELHERFDRIVSPLIQKSQVLQRKAENLRRTRDLLLPRLLSGQLTLPAQAA